MRCRGGEDERHPAVPIGDRSDPGPGALDHRIIERSHLGQDLESRQRRSRLALRGADVGLQGMAETAVGITVGAERFEDRCHLSAAQKDGQSVTFEHSRVGKDEPLCCADVDWHSTQATRS